MKHERPVPEEITSRGVPRTPEQPVWALRLIAAFAVFTALVLSACQTLGGKTIEIEFRSAAGIKGGEAVYVAGVQIGVAGEPVLANGGIAKVPVRIFRRDKGAFPPGIIFVVQEDPSDVSKQSLVGLPCDAIALRSGDAATSYQGASGTTEFYLKCASETIRDVWRGLSK